MEDVGQRILYFTWFPQFTNENSQIIFKLRHDSFLLHPVQFTSHRSSKRLGEYHLKT
jgi:hypothetical protein